MRVYTDLHIHSCLSPCGDDLMTPNNIANMAMLKKLDVIAVADHNSALNLPAINAVCQAVGIELLPAIELTTREEIHLLGYFPSVECALSFSNLIHSLLPPIKNRPEFFGPQLILDEDDEPIGSEDNLLISALDASVDELTDMLHSHGAVAVPAHINRGNNGILNVLGFLPPTSSFDAVEVYKSLPCPADVSAFKVLHSSDAHRLEDMFERSEWIEASAPSAAAVFDAISKS